MSTRAMIRSAPIWHRQMTFWYNKPPTLQKLRACHAHSGPPQQPDDLDEPGEVAKDLLHMMNGQGSNTVVLTKIHIRGLDSLHTDQVKAYVKAHYAPLDRVEWIDDGSANLVFGSEVAAREAITALSSIELADATALAVGETLPAKPLDGHPDVSLQVRFALQGDRKQAGAAARSRYYLLHPEHDPEERRRRQHENRSRYRDRDGPFGRACRGSSHHKADTFEASMYDDAPSYPRRNSDPEERFRLFARENRGKELFRDRASGRDRSASPEREYSDDGRVHVLASSSRRNRDCARVIKGRLPENNRTKELFSTKSSGRGGQLDQLERCIGSASLREEDMPKMASTPAVSSTSMFIIRGLASQELHSDSGGFSIKGAATSAKELFPDLLGGSNAGKELLDPKRSDRRQKAHDLFS